MSRPYYSEYVRHCLRFYTRNLVQPTFRNSADENNWMACKHVIGTLYPDVSRNIIIDVYGNYDTLPDNVYEASKKYDIHQNVIWDLLKDVESKVAVKRGLV